MFELILTAESKILANNLVSFEQQAKAFLANLTTSFDTDDDFTKAKEEIKTLKTVEEKTKAAINSVLESNADLNTILDAARDIAETFRQERLKRERLVKAREEEIKNEIAINAINEVEIGIKSLFLTTAISKALDVKYPSSLIKKRIEGATKNKKTIDGLTKGVNAEKTLLTAEISQEIARLTIRSKHIPEEYKYLFSDEAHLIALEDDIKPIVDERIKDEEERIKRVKEQAKVKALEDQNKALESTKKDLEPPTQEPKQAPIEEEKAIIDPNPHPQNNEKQNFVIRVPATEITFSGELEEAKEIARYLSKYIQGIKLIKGN